MTGGVFNNILTLMVFILKLFFLKIDLLLWVQMFTRVFH